MKLWCGLESNARPIGPNWKYHCEPNDIRTDPTAVSKFCETYLSTDIPEVISVDTDFFYVVDMLHNLGKSYKKLQGIDLIFKIHVHDEDTLIRGFISASPYLEEVTIIML